MPGVVSQQNVQITTVSGVQTVENPLFQYKFQTFPLNPVYFPSSASDGFLSNDPYTIRGAVTLGTGDNPSLVNQYLESENLMSNTVSNLHRFHAKFSLANVR
jgi:tyrosinase